MATSTVSVQTQLDEFMEGVKKQAPPAVLAVVDKANQDLAASSKFNRALKVGEKAPSFELPNAAGQLTKSDDLIAKGPLVVSFYRGAWCPFCNIELNALGGVLPEIQKLGANLVAISPEKPDYSAGLIEKHQLKFEVLTDGGNQVARQFGIVFTLEGDLRQVSQQAFGVDLPKFNGDNSWELPVPATFVLDRKGVAQFAFVDPEFRHRAEPAEILQTLKRLADQ